MTQVLFAAVRVSLVRVIGRPLGAVVLLGLPGADKTTLAEGLTQRFGARLVSRDEIRRGMFRPCSFTDAEKAAAFSAVIGAVRTNCALGHLSIVEGMPFSRREPRGQHNRR